MGAEGKNAICRVAATFGPQSMTAQQGRAAENSVKEMVPMTSAEPKRADDGQMVVPDFVIDTIARCLLPQLQTYFASQEGQAAFEAWKQSQTNKSTIRRNLS